MDAVNQGDLMVSSSFRRAPRVKLLCALVASCFAVDGLANPTGPAVVSGSASFNTVGKNLTVTNSPNAIINWQGFSIGAGEATRFQQQSVSSAVLNRIVGQDPSVILGTLWSNGRVFLVNPNGILFGQGSRVDVGGLVASTLNITDRDFLAGRLSFQAGAVANSVVNQGEIVSSSGGRIYLIAPDVQNHGLISSPGGEVLLAAGKTVSLVDADVPNLQVEVQAGGEALNVGKILAEGGKAGIYAGLINQRGVVRADSVSKDATGRIVFRASDTTILDEGSVTSAAGAKGGEILVLGNKVGLVGSARVDASGDAGGGTVLVGGDYQGKNADVQNAWRTYMGPQSSITTDAITTGDGGKIIVWSDDATRAYGSISARGGSQSGNGGFVEVSGKSWLDFNATVDTSAPKGATGVLLLDPAAVSITNTSDSGGSFNSGNPNIFSSGGSSSTLTWTTIKNHLTGAGGGSNTNVYVTTSGCSLPGSCGIDILDNSPDLAASNTLRLVSHEAINVSGSITNTGSGALEMYAGWDGTSPVSSPTLNNFAGTITVSQPITFTGDVLLRAFLGITDSAGATITTPNLLASASSSSVNLSSATHMVGTLAGRFHNDFSFKNGQTLTIGSVGGVSGISTVPSAGGAPTLQLTVTTGNLVVNSPISVTDGGGTTATTSVALNALNGNVSVNNTTVSATAVADDTNDGQPASVALNATNGGILISNSAVSAHGGPGIGSGDTGGSATVLLRATGGITANSSSTVSATGGAPGFDTLSGASGGDANVQLIAGGTIDLSSSALSATKGNPLAGSLGTSGVGTVSVAVNSTTSGNPSGSGDIIADNITADNVNLQQESLGVAKSILRASGTSLIGANQLLMEVDDPANVGGGSIGTSSAPMRVQVAKLEAHTHEASPGIFIDSPNPQNLQIGGVSFFGGIVKGVQNVTSGDILIGVNGNLTLQTGSPNSPCGTGTGGPICTTSGNVTLRANDMDIAHTVFGTGTVTLAAYNTTQNIDIGSLPIGSGPLSIAASEINNVTASTLIIGRSDSTSNILYLNQGLSGSNVHASTLKLQAFDIYENGSGGISGPFDLILRAGRNIDLAQNSLTLSDNRNLSVLANSDNQNGTLNIGGVTLQVGTTAANTGSMTLQGQNINAIVSGGGSTSIAVFGTGAQSITATGDLTVQNDNVGAGGGMRVQADGGAQTINVGGAFNITAGTGTGTSATVSGGTQTVTAGTLLLQGGASGTSNLATLTSVGNQTVTAGTITVNGGAGGGGFGIGNNAAINSNGSQTVSVGSGGITLTAGGGEDNAAAINQLGLAGTSQTINVSGGGAIVLQGGSSAAMPSGGLHGARAVLSASGDSQTLAFASGGSLSITGGTVGSRNFAIVISDNAQTISGAPSITLTGGASGGIAGNGNFARISSNNATQTTSASSIDVRGGAGGIENLAQIGQFGTTGSQIITVSGGVITVTGGGGGTSNFARIRSLGTAQSIDAAGSGIILTGGAGGGGSGTGNFAQIISDSGSQSIAVGGNGLRLFGGGGGLTDNFASVFQAGLSGTSQTITLNGGGSIVMLGGSSAQQNVQPTAPPPNHGSFAFIRSDGDAQAIAFTSGGGIQITGGTVGSNNNAGIRAANGTQTISGSPDIALTGGASGGVDNEGNFAMIFANSAGQTITAGNVSLTAGAGGVNNFAAIIAPTQTITVHGDLGLTGGGSAAGVNTGGGARIGGPGAASPGPTNLTLAVDGNVAMTGGSAANAGAAIGSGFQGGQTTTITMGVGGNVTLNPGTVVNGGSRIGSPSASIAGGNIAITAGGTLALNSTGPGLGTAIRTLGNVTINAASVTQGPDSEIIAGGTTSLTGGSISLSSASNDFTGAVSISGSGSGNVAVGDVNGIILGASTLGTGTFTVTANGPITQTGPIVQAAGAGAATFHAGSNAITLTNASNDFTGPVDVDSTGTVAITDANSFIIKGGGGGGGAPASFTLNANGAVTQSAAFIGTAPAVIVINAGTGPISLNNAGNNFTGNTSVAGNTTGAVSLTNNNAGGINLGTSSVGGALALTSGGPVTQTGAITVGGTSTINAGSNPITLTNVANDFIGAVSLTGSNVAITDMNTISIGTTSVSGTFTITATSTSFLNGFSATNYSFSGGVYTLAAGTYNLGGTTTVAGTATVAASSATINAAGGTINVSGVLDSGTSSITVGTLNVLAGGTLTGTGTIIGNLNNSAGTVSPGASPGIITITGNYVQGASGTLAMQIGGLTAGSGYDQLVVGGTTSLAGTLNASLIGTFVPPPGSTYTFVQGSGPLSGTFTTVNQPAGALFNTFYGPTTFEFIAVGGGGGVVPPPIEPSFNNSIVSLEQLSQPLIELIETIPVSVVPPTTTTTAEGTLVPKPPACN